MTEDGCLPEHADASAQAKISALVTRSGGSPTVPKECCKQTAASDGAPAAASPLLLGWEA